MSRVRYTPEEREDALVLYAEVGAAETARRTGIARGTLQSWAHRNGVQSVAAESTRAATEGSLVRLAERKVRLAADLMADIERLRQQLFAPTVVRKVVTLGGGMHSSATWEIADVDLDQPSFVDQRAIMTTLAIAIDKVQVLTGGATDIHEHRHVDSVDAELQRLAEQLEHQDQPT